MFPSGPCFKDLPEGQNSGGGMMEEQQDVPEGGAGQSDWDKTIHHSPGLVSR